MSTLVRFSEDIRDEELYKKYMRKYTYLKPILFYMILKASSKKFSLKISVQTNNKIDIIINFYLQNVPIYSTAKNI